MNDNSILFGHITPYTECGRIKYVTVLGYPFMPLLTFRIDFKNGTASYFLEPEKENFSQVFTAFNVVSLEELAGKKVVAYMDKSDGIRKLVGLRPRRYKRRKKKT